MEKKIPDTILIADDEPIIRELAQEIIELEWEKNHEKGRCFIASNGDEAVKIFMDNSASIKTIVMDVMMPVKDGIKAFEEIRKVAPHVHVIFSSGYAESDRIAKLRAEKNNLDFINKPYTKTMLIQKISH